MVQTLLFVAGLNTLFQTSFGTRLPAVVGGSYTFVVPTISIILAGRYSDIVDPREVSRLAHPGPGRTIFIEFSISLS